MIRKQAAGTAAAVGLDDRGTIEVGKKADVNVIDLDHLTLHPPRSVDDLPAGGRRILQDASGYVATIVSGVVTRRDDRDTGALSGSPRARPLTGAVTVPNVAMVMPGPGTALELTERPVPEPGPGEAIVRVRASSLNYHDLVNLMGLIDGPWPRVPMTDGAGEVVAVGDDVRGSSSVGDRVIGAFHPAGSRSA